MFDLRKFPLIFFISFIFISPTFAQILPELEKVKEIKLLEHTRDNVRRILAGYKLEADEENYYDWFSKFDAKIRVDYSEGNCDEFGFEGFKVSEWKAIYIIVEFDSPIKTEDLEIDISRFKKEQKYFDIDDIYVYYDKEVGVVFTIQDDKLETIEFIPPPKYYGLMCNQEMAKKLSSTSSIFVNDLEERRGIISCPVARVEELKLSQIEVVVDCSSSKPDAEKTCLSKTKTIDVLTLASDPDGDSLAYSYTVSVGKIIGKGANIKWDLSDVLPGTYTITAAVDDGCGFCGKTMTKTVVVKECPDCKKP